MRPIGNSPKPEKEQSRQPIFDRSQLIDVWNLETFDTELRVKLEADADDIRNFMLKSSELCFEWEASDYTKPYPENPYAGVFKLMTEQVVELMKARVIRAWHYSRMTDAELEKLVQGGVYTSTLDNIRLRLDAQVNAGALTQEAADKLFADSPYQNCEQRSARSNKFWMVSHPVETSDGRVKPLLESWGGEALYFCQKSEELKLILRSLGKPRVIEIALPLEFSRHSFPAAKAVIATFGRSLGCDREKKDFDLYTHQSLGPDHILEVHSEGDSSFIAMGCEYPKGFVDVDSVR